MLITTALLIKAGQVMMKHPAAIAFSILFLPQEVEEPVETVCKVSEIRSKNILLEAGR